jgi:rod shape-determining protein MreD
LILVAAVLQAGVLRHLNFKPDLLLILLVFFAIYCNSFDVIITSFVIGFAADIIGTAMGPHMISFCLLGTLLAYLHGIVAIKRMLYQGLAILVVGLLAGLLGNLFHFIKGEMTVSYSVLFWACLYSAVVGPFLFLPAAWWMRIKWHRFRGY